MLLSKRFLSSLNKDIHAQKLLTQKLTKDLTHYEILDLKPEACLDDIKKSFKRLSKSLHPDLNQNKSDSLQSTIKYNYQKVIQSYKVLCNKDKRNKYDKSINASQFRNSSAQTYNNQMSHKFYYGSGFIRARKNLKYDTFDKTTYTTGSNYDVSHFDYDKHLKGNLWFERRMINKRLNKIEQESFQDHMEKSDVDKEMKDTLNLHRYANYKDRTGFKEELQKSGQLNTFNGTFVGLVLGLGLITVANCRSSKNGVFLTIGLLESGSLLLLLLDLSFKRASSALTSIPAETKASDNLSGSAGAVGLANPLSSSSLSSSLVRFESRFSSGKFKLGVIKGGTASCEPEETAEEGGSEGM
ncbi:hypothetical protein WICMUC_004331 [Wickerhamomyces mucosus]|uniref:J domain-containing protein n=1 Tax=Wickerhamomyces mucosus TaxID=1378264 RepID=A0A9P8PJC1_9ASCO|nr:hypothetical protein WICMUC_004331 [Wickerhamomyces mucosus]